MDYIVEENRIYLNDENGKMIAEITYPKRNDFYVINHTFVDDSLRGKGVAGKLVSMAISEIEKKGGKVFATCSYAKAYLEKKGK